jgi:nicotinamidase-related amidase
MHAMMIVDVQAALAVPPDLVAKIRTRAAQFPLRVFTQFVNPPGTLFRRKMNRRNCPPGDPGTRLLIEPQPGDLVLEKSGYGLTPEHIRALRSREVNEVTVSGVDTDACVLGVMFSLWDHGIDCHIEPELCWSSSGLHEKALEIAYEQFGE